MSARVRFASLIALTGVVAACAGRGGLFDRPQPSEERVNPDIPAGQFTTITSIAAGDMRIDLQVAVTVRGLLQDSGVAVTRVPGRWDSSTDALRSLCAPGAVPPLDGVLFVWHNRLELRDCASGTVAYEITSKGEEGINQLTNRLIRYLRGGPPQSSGSRS